MFADQFIQISTLLDTGLFYGLGEHKDRILHNATDWHQMTFWAHDMGPTVCDLFICIFMFKLLLNLILLSYNCLRFNM